MMFLCDRILFVRGAEDRDRLLMFLSGDDLHRALEQHYQRYFYPRDPLRFPEGTWTTPDALDRFDHDDWRLVT